MIKQMLKYQSFENLLTVHRSDIGLYFEAREGLQHLSVYMVSEKNPLQYYDLKVSKVLLSAPGQFPSKDRQGQTLWMCRYL